jgi:hypothetical protein
LSNAAAAAAAAAADADADADADYIRADQSSSSEYDYSRCSTFLSLSVHKISPISKNNLFLLFLFSVQTANISLTSSSISSDVKSRYTNTFYSTVHQSPPQKNFFRAATHAADNNQIGTRDPRLKPSPADAAHIW